MCPRTLAAEQAEALRAWCRTGLSDAPAPGFLQLPYQANGELIERALCLYDAGLYPTGAAHGRFGALR
jgi:hypothetical protein